MNNDEVRLIDANALLKKIDEERQYLVARGQLGAEHILVHNFRDLVEQAPTVRTDNYSMGYQDGVRKVLSEVAEEKYRSPDEWEDYSVDFYKCPDCGYLLEKDCPHCGRKVVLPDRRTETQS